MEISKEKILDLSKQIYMEITEEEAEKLSEDMKHVVKDMQVLSKVDVSNVRPDVAVLENSYNVFRKDEVMHYEEKEVLLSNARELEDDMFKIPKIV